MLQDKPKFSDIADEFIEFIRDARLVVHNAPFDLGFLRNELSSLGLPNIEELCPVIFDTLSVAREQRRGKKNSLDALCTAHQINVPDNDMRGALLDAYMLAEVYLAMTNGPPHEGRETEGK